MGIFRELFNNRWLIFVAAMWVEASAGTGYLFGSLSPVIKTSLSYNQRQIARLGVAKDLGDNVGFLAGALCEILPIWGALLIGVLQNLFGYGCVWLVVTGKLPELPMWVMCLLIFIATNGETYFNTAVLVSCVKNFPKSRGTVVGILKGYAGLSGAIWTQIYATINAPDQASIIFMVAVGPSMVIIALMFIVRPIGGDEEAQAQPSDHSSFIFIYSVCLLLGAYLFGVMIVQDLVEVNYSLITVFTTILIVLLVIPITTPMFFGFRSNTESLKEDMTLVLEPQKQEPSVSGQSTDVDELIFSVVEDENPSNAYDVQVSELTQELKGKFFRATAEGAVSIKWRKGKGPRRGEDFTLMEALKKADLWLIFFSVLLGSGSGLTVIDNLGQMSESLGYEDTHIFVSLISVWNFLGRIAGGYVSEIIVREYAYPRAMALAIAQLIMAIGHFFFAMAWPGTIYVGPLLIGLGYGVHWAIVPATASELFGLKSFGALYNFFAMANPAGSLIFSGLIASVIYDREAEKQSGLHILQKMSMPMVGRTRYKGGLSTEEVLKCKGQVCFFLSSLIMSGLCLIAVILTMILVRRTKIVYATLYRKALS